MQLAFQLDPLSWLFLILAIFGAVGSLPAITAEIRAWKYNGASISGTWQTEWLGQDGSKHTNITHVKQHGAQIKMLADNEWKDEFVGKVIGNHVLGSWTATIGGVFDYGVFIMRLMPAFPPTMEGEFTSLDDKGLNLEILHTKMVKLDDSDKKVVNPSGQT